MMNVMTKEIKDMNIFEKMSAIQQEAPVVGKKYLVEKGNKSFSVVRAADVIRAIKPLEAKYHVFSYPTDESKIEHSVFEKTYSEYKRITLQKDRMEIKYRFVNMDNPQDFIEMNFFGTGIDIDDKSPGMAMTYATKTALIHAYKLEQGDIDDPNRGYGVEDDDYQVEKTNPVDITYASVEEADMEPVADGQQTMFLDQNRAVGDGLPHTLEDARKVIISAGELKGTVGELWDDPMNKERLLKFHATARAFEKDEKRYPEKVAALKIMLESEGISI